MTTDFPHRLRAGHVRRPRPAQIMDPTGDRGTALVRPVASPEASPVASVVRRIERESSDASDEALTVVVIDGEIDADTAVLVRLALADALDGPAPVCCDLTGVTFFGAAAARTVLAAHSCAMATERIFFLRGVRGITAKVLDVVDPDRLVPR
jgi:anti-anti-sigma factor